MPMTLPSHTSLMTAQDPPRHGVRDNAPFEIPASATMLAERLRQAGFDTGAFVAAYILHSRWGLARGFDRYDDEGVHGIGSILPATPERPGEEVLAAALPWIVEPREEPFFAWVHLYEPHAPYEPPEPFASRFPERPYDGEVAHTDRLIGGLLDGLEESELLEETVVAVTADHGEGLGDHGEPDHGLLLYDSTIRVPLILRLPGEAAAGLEVDEQVRLIDVAPTLLDVVGLEAPESFDGSSLLPFLIDQGEGRPAYSETLYPRWHFGWQELFVLRKDGLKYIQAPTPELYAVGPDPGESDNLADRRPDRAAAMAAELDSMTGDRVEGPGTMSAEAARQLRSLGYLGSAPADLPEGPLADPKDKVEVYARLVEATRLVNDGRFAEGAAAMQEVIAADPRVVDAHYSLGKARLAQGDAAGAVEAFEAAVELRPDNVEALVDLAVARLELGELAAARRELETVLALDPRNAQARFHLGEMALEAGDPATALAHLETAVEIYEEPLAPRFAMGVAFLQLGRLERAEEELDRVVERAPDYADAHFQLALVAEARGDTDTAAARYRTALEHAPGHFRARFNLALIHAGRRDHAAAARGFRETIRARPDLALAHVYLARSLLLLQDPASWAEAEEAARRGLELSPPPEVVPTAHYVLADIYRRQGRQAEAERHAALARQAERALKR